MTARARAKSIAAMTDVSVAGPPPQQPQRHHHGWAIAFAVVAVLALGVLVAAVISRGDEGTATNTVPAPTFQQQSTTINAQPQVTTVSKTVTAPPATVTVQPQVTVQGQTSTAP